jgi:hypothetical protein
VVRSAVGIQRRPSERAEERLEARAHGMEALRDSSHATRLLVDSQGRCRAPGERLAHFKRELDSRKWDWKEELGDVVMVSIDALRAEVEAVVRERAAAYWLTAPRRASISAWRECRWQDGGSSGCQALVWRQFGHDWRPNAPISRLIPHPPSL